MCSKDTLGARSEELISSQIKNVKRNIIFLNLVYGSEPKTAVVSND